MRRGQSFEERENLLRSEDRRYKSLGSVYQNKCKVYKRRWYILIIFSIVASLNNLIWNTWGPIQGTAQVVFGWDNTTITLLADWGPISFVVAVVPMCWLMDMKGKHKYGFLNPVFKSFSWLISVPVLRAGKLSRVHIRPKGPRFVKLTFITSARLLPVNFCC